MTSPSPPRGSSSSRASQRLLFEERQRAESFGAVAEQYDRARPTYPPELIDALLSHHPASALDVGCGTGIASALLVHRGVSVLGIEIDPRMAAVARRKGIEVEVTRFEDWERRGRSFELLTAGQSWHWVHPVLGAQRAADALLPGGRICLFWNFGGPPPEVQELLDPIYAELGPVDESPAQRADARGEATLHGLRQSRAFSEPQVHSFPWHTRYHTHAWLDQIATQSNHQTLPPQRLRALLDALEGAIDGAGGSFEVEYRTLLVSASRL